MALALNVANDIMGEVFPGISRTKWGLPNDRERFEFQWGQERFTLNQPMGGSGGLEATWSGVIRVSDRLVGSSEFSSEVLESRNDFVGWVSEVCDRIMTDAQKSLVQFFRFPDALFPPSELGAALYHVYLLSRLGVMGPMAAKIEEALPDWTWTQGESPTKFHRKLTSEDGLSTGSLAVNNGVEVSSGKNNIGFLFHLHSSSPLVKSEKLEFKTFVSGLALGKQVRGLFILEVLRVLSQWGQLKPLWQPVQRS